MNGSTPLYVTSPPDASALPPAHENVSVDGSVPSTRCQKTACSIGPAASCAVVPICAPAGRRRDRAGRAHGQLRDQRIAADRRRRFCDAEARRARRPGGGTARRAARAGRERARGDQCDRVDQVRHRQRLVVELQAERPAGARSLERPAHASRRDVAAALVEDRDREDVEACELTAAREGHAAVRVDRRRALSCIELPAPGASSLPPLDRQELLGSVDAEEDRLASEARASRDAARVALPAAAARAARAESDRRVADVSVEALAVDRERRFAGSPTHERRVRAR